ncbi:hypothetical protein LINPERPRIM_LOCUS31631 [Linum perenne]
MINILGKAKNIKTELEWLHKSNPGKESITSELKGKWRETVLQDVMALREQIRLELREMEKEMLQELLVEMEILVESNGEEISSSSSSSSSIQGKEEEYIVGKAAGIFLVERIKEQQRKNCKCWIGLFLLLVLFILLVKLSPMTN